MNHSMQGCTVVLKVSVGKMWMKRRMREKKVPRTMM